MPEDELPAIDDPDHLAKATEAVRVAAVEFLGAAPATCGPTPPATTASTGTSWSTRRMRQARNAASRSTGGPTPTRPTATCRRRPGTGEYRLRPDGSGFEHLVLAGDWTDNGVNAGCIEAAVVSGVQAANAVEGRPMHDGISSGARRTDARPRAGGARGGGTLR